MQIYFIIYKGEIICSSLNPITINDEFTRLRNQSLKQFFDNRRVYCVCYQCFIENMLEYESWEDLLKQDQTTIDQVYFSVFREYYHIHETTLI